MTPWREIWRDPRLLFAVYALLAIIASVDNFHREIDVVEGHNVTHYNNYVIFRNAGEHLAEGQDLYQFWPQEQWDLYKYSPTFAAAMWPLTQIPDVVGLIIWNVAGALLLLCALRSLPLSSASSAGAAWIVAKDLLTNLQNSQSNALVAAAMIFTCVYWERKRLAAAATALAWTFYIKIFGVAVLLLWMLYPHKVKSAAWMVGIGVGFAIIPLLLTSPDLLAQQYQSWWNMLRGDHAASLGMSVMGLLTAWFGITGHKTITVVIGGLILLSPILRRSQFKSLRFRLGMLASVLMWVVLFNHKAESPTFVIATAGVAVWFASRPVTRANIALVVLTVLLSGFSSSDLAPDWLQRSLLEPYQFKVLPSLLVWLKLQGELWLTTDIPAVGSVIEDLQLRPVELLSRAA